MDEEDSIIREEGVSLLQNFFSHLPETVIRDVLNRPDVLGNVELASAVLGSLFDEPGTDVMNYDAYASFYPDEDWNEDDDKHVEYVTGEA